MARNLFVGGIPWAVDDAELREHFEHFGPVADARVIRDRITGRSRGFGFVKFEHPNDATTARRQLDGSVFAGRTIKVDEARGSGARVAREPVYRS